jgi:hypothetical protein
MVSPLKNVGFKSMPISLFSFICLKYITVQNLVINFPSSQKNISRSRHTVVFLSNKVTFVSFDLDFLEKNKVFEPLR